MNKKIGLDVDGVLACFSHGVIKRAKELNVSEHFPSTCLEVDSWDMSEMFSYIMQDAWNQPKFWAELPPLKGALPLPFTPEVYITSRRIPGEVTKAWLKRNGFPEAPVITVSNPAEKLRHVLDLDIDIFVDDLYSTVREMRQAGVNALLFKAPYQVGHEEDCKGLPTIERLEEVLNYV
jgi:FMN phosphatase YigB (HAD superfamily)